MPLSSSSKTKRPKAGATTTTTTAATATAAAAAAGKFYKKDNALAWEENYFRDRFVELVAYKAQHGHTDVPYRDVTTTTTTTIGQQYHPGSSSSSILGAWTKAVRRQYKNGELPARRIQLLQTIGFNLNTNEDVMALEQRYFVQRIYELVEYRAVHGHCNVPKNYHPHGDKNNNNSNTNTTSSAVAVLSKWVHSVRAQYKRNEVPADRVRILSSLGFEWKQPSKSSTGKTAASAKAVPCWNELVEGNPLLDVGNNNSDATTKKDGNQEATNNSQNQVTTKTTTATSSSYKQQEQQSKGVRAMAYAADLDAKWNRKFEELLAYKEMHGHVNVPQDHKELGRWVSTQREKKRQADLVQAGYEFPPDKKRRPCLPADQIAKLESIGFKWKVNTIVGWDARYQQLLEYKRQNGNVHVPQSHPLDVAFGRWVMKQRVQYNYRKKGLKNHMTDDRIGKLEAIGFAWVAPGFSQKTRKRKRPDEEDEQELETDVQQVGNGAISDQNETQPEDLLGVGEPTNTDPSLFVPTPFYHTPPPAPDPQPYML